MVYFVASWRFRNLKSLRSSWPLVILVYLVFCSISATVFHNSGIDEWIKSLGLHSRVVEILSTALWSLVLSSITVLPLSVFRGTVYQRYLPWIILTTLLAAMLFLAGYITLLPMSDQYRGILVAIGMRSGMFLGLYMTAVRASVSE